jgi:hypothetical protein
MGTDQIMDLFSLDGGDQEKSSSVEGKVGTKEILESLDQLWDEAEYDDLEVDDFLANLKSRRKIKQ